jgi:hypothetical protein
MGQEVTRTIRERKPSVRQHRGPATPIEDCDAQLFLESTHLHADGRDRQPDSVACLSEAASVGNGYECVKRFDVHV